MSLLKWPTVLSDSYSEPTVDTHQPPMNRSSRHPLRLALACMLFVGGLAVSPFEARAVTQNVTFSIITDGTVGSVGLDIINNGASPYGYEQMVRWSSDGQLWNWNWMPGSVNYGYRTSATNGFTFSQAATIVRLEVYPHNTSGCTGSDESNPCYWNIYDPWVDDHGGVQIQVDSTMGSNWLDIGPLPLTKLGVGDAFRIDGNIVSSTPVPDNRVEVDLFQIDCSWHETCVHPPTTASGREYGSFGTSKSRGMRWTGGVGLPGRYVIFIRDTATGRNFQGLVDIANGAVPTIDLDAICFGLRMCVQDSGSTPAAAGNFHPMSPMRILDTRSGVGITDGPVRAGDGSQTSTNPQLRMADTFNHDLKVTGVAGIPDSGVSAVLLNVTVVDAPGTGFLTIGPRPSGVGDVFNDQNTYGAWPTASNLNLNRGETVPNLVLARVGAGGRIRLYNYGYPTHIVADVAGWFDSSSAYTAGASTFIGITPARILDSRQNLGTTSRFAAGDDRAITVTGIAGVPTNATSVVLNITAADPGGWGYVTAYPDGATRPNVSNVNYDSGRDRPNLVVVTPGANGKVRLFVGEKSTHLIVDVFGYYTATGSVTTTTHAIDPSRVFDTRTGVGTSAAMLAPGETRTVQIAGAAGVPANATAVYLNVTSVNATGWGWLSLWPTGTDRPVVSNVNFPGGTAVPNMAIMKLGTNGSIQVYNDASQGTSTHVLVDVMGYVA